TRLGDDSRRQRERVGNGGRAPAQITTRVDCLHTTRCERNSDTGRLGGGHRQTFRSVGTYLEALQGDERIRWRSVLVSGPSKDQGEENDRKKVEMVHDTPSKR